MMMILDLTIVVTVKMLELDVKVFEVPLITHNIMCLSPATCEDGSVRLIIGDDAEFYYQGYYSDDYDGTYYEKGRLTRGRVEVCIGGRYGTICYEEWDYEDASVICSQLGFLPHGMYG